MNLERETRAGPAQLRQPLWPMPASERRDGSKFEVRTGRQTLISPTGRTDTDHGATGIAVGLLLPAVQAAREAARRASGQANLSNILMAMHQYQIEKSLASQQLRL